MEVVNGKADAFIYDAPYNAVAIGQRGEGKLVFWTNPSPTNRSAGACARAIPNSLKWLNGFLVKVKQDGDARETVPEVV
jgi:polar amino acid transport system substrate-binding protein